MEHKQVNNLHVKGVYIGKTPYGKYLDAIGNIGLYLLVFVAHEVSFLRVIFSEIPFLHLKHVCKVKVKGF